MSDTCTCPICPLTADNVQTCDVIVRICDDGYNIMPQAAQKYHKQFYQLAYEAKVNKTRVNQDYTYQGQGYEFNVKRLTKDLYKVCFHTLKTEAKEEDPLDMD